MKIYSSKEESIPYFCDLHQQIARMILAGRKKFTKESCVRMPFGQVWLVCKIVVIMQYFSLFFKTISLLTGWYWEATTHTSTHHDMKNKRHHSVN